MPEKKTPNETVAHGDEEDSQYPGTIAYVEKHTHNSHNIMLTILLSQIVFSTVSTSASAFAFHVNV